MIGLMKKPGESRAFLYLGESWGSAPPGAEPSQNRLEAQRTSSTNTWSEA